MTSMLLAVIVLTGTLVQATQANYLPALTEEELRERRLLGDLVGGLLGGGGDGEEGGKGGGGLLGGLLGGGGKGGGGGLLGGLLGGGKDGGGGGLLGGLLGGGKGGGGLLGGLLGGGKGGGGLLGGLLGGKDGGLLGGLLGGKGGLLGGLLGGKDGLLGGLLGGKDGLLGGLLGGKDGGLLGGLLGGDGLLGSLIGKNGLLPLGIVDEVLCLVKTIGLPSVNRVLDEAGLDKLLSLHNITCADGHPLLEEGSTAAGLLEQLISYLGIDLVTEANVDSVVKLAQQLTQEGISDLKLFVERVHCLIRHVGLDDFVGAVEIVGVASGIRLNDVVCPNASVSIDLVANAKFRNTGVLPQLLKSLGLEAVIAMIADVGVIKLIHLGTYVSINGTIDVPTFNQVVCITSSVGIDVSIALLENIGLDNVIALYGTICPNGQALLFPTRIDPAFLVELLTPCIKQSTTECLDALSKSFSYAGDSVCPFCPQFKHPEIITECSNVCNPAPPS